MDGPRDPRFLSKGADREERARWQDAMADCEVTTGQDYDGKTDQSFRIHCEDRDVAQVCLYDSRVEGRDFG